MASELINSHLATDLTIELPSGTYLFTDSPRTDAMTDLPAEFTSRTWFVITAWNPRSKPDLPKANDKNQAELRALLIDSGYAVFDAYGADSNPEGSYGGEPMLAVYQDEEWDDLTHEIAELAISFQQNAYFKIEGNVVYLLPGLMPEAIGVRQKNIVRIKRSEQVAAKRGDCN